MSWIRCFSMEILAGATPSRNGNVRHRHEDVSIWENVNPYRMLSLWWSNHLKIRRGWSKRRPFHRHVFENSLKHGRATDNTTLVCNTPRQAMSHFMTLERSVVDPLATLPVECGWKDIPTQWRRLAPTVKLFVGLLLVVRMGSLPTACARY